MKLNETIAEARKRKGLTQEQLAQKLYVTRQAVSRWECGEVVPGIDMLKLIAITLEEPIVHLLDMPEHYCESCGMMLSPDEYGTIAMAPKPIIIANGALNRGNIPMKHLWKQ